MNRRMLFGSGLARAFACLLLVVTTFVVSPRLAAAQANPVAQAQQQYDGGKFAEALLTVRNAISTGAVMGSNVIGARELMARCQVKVGDAAGARATFLQILRLDPQYRIDTVRTPPDEVEVFQQALKAFEAEQLQAKQRIPASVTAFYGIGSGSNTDFGDYVKLGGGDEKFDNKAMFGFGVRFPLAPRWSLDLEMSRLRATNEDTVRVTGSGHGEYELTATPMVVSIVYLVRDSGKLRASVFFGAGPMLNSYAADKFSLFGSIPIKTTDTKVGKYLHAGLEGEYAFHPKLSLTGRALFRSAKAEKMYDGLTFTQYATGNLGNRDLDFSGYGLTIGLRGYVGY
ncbi:MAG: hypothetical protein HZA61_00065 [Candidatus Eisenbacteria bacterium]|uniref:Outer membrane protein beta-barrel domain-containing protein n=1 Tax=Eiseniibacteriota bacterium TaxID=2212470 RepID=A0A933SAF9_UNCEI|nr:hypothetical protein [Candidatus Eisenbacteria bacterium]